ncbi:MAG: GIY-YIG nuclease family protein [Candidatus Acidiferrales bacterium]|jgi:putative endonuclease
MKTYWIYILSNESKVLYTGVTNDLVRRVAQHKAKQIPGFTQRYNLTRLVYFEQSPQVVAAIRREKEIEGWLRAKKVALVESFNPAWRDLAPKLR